MYVHTEKRRRCRVDRYLLHGHSVRMYCTYWCTYCMYLLMIHVRILKENDQLLEVPGTYPLLYVRIYCIYLVLVYQLLAVCTCCTYCCSYWCRHVQSYVLFNQYCKYTPSARNGCTYCTYLLLYLLYVPTAVPTVRTYCCTYNWLMYSYTAASTADECMSTLFYVLPVPSGSA